MTVVLIEHDVSRTCSQKASSLGRGHETSIFQGFPHLHLFSQTKKRFVPCQTLTAVSCIRVSRLY